MRISRERVYILFIAILLVVGEIYSSDTAFIIVFGMCMLAGIKNALHVRVSRPILVMFLILFIGIFVGIIEASVNRDFIRDIFKILSPILYLMYGKNLGESNKISFQGIFSTVNIAALFIGIRSIFYKILAIASNGVSFNSIRGMGGNASPTVIVAFAILFLFSKEEFPKWIRNKRNVLLAFYTIVNLMYLSRTVFFMWLPFVIVYIIVNAKKTRAFKIFFLVFISIVGAYLLIPESLTTPFINKILGSIKEISSNNNNWSWKKINNDWRGYEVYLIKREFINYSFLRKLVGFGFGKVVNLPNEILLGDYMYKSISIFHNGYYYLYLKCGLLGVFSYIYYLGTELLKYLKMLVKRSNVNYAIMQLCLVLAFASSCYVIAGMFNGAYLISMCVIFGYLGCNQFKKGQVR